MPIVKNLTSSLIVLAAIAVSTNGLASEWPDLKLKASEHPLHLPDGWYVGEVTAVDFDSLGHFYVFNRGQHPLLKFDADGNFVREIGQGLFKVPHGMRVDEENNIWTTDQETHQVIKFNQDGKIDLLLGRRDGPGKRWYDHGYNVALLSQPSDVGLDSDGNIYVADAGNFRIVKYTPFGEPIMTWGSEGAKPGEFNFPHSIVVDGDDKIYVTDRENGRIQIFSSSGEFIKQWDHVGYPYVVKLAANNTIWMTDARSGKILNMDLTGRVLGGFGQWGKEIGDFGFGHGITLNDEGQIFVGEILNWRVQKLSPFGL